MTLAYNKEAELFVEFLKVLGFSFPVPVIGPSAPLSVARFAAENMKNF